MFAFRFCAAGSFTVVAGSSQFDKLLIDAIGF